MAEVPSVSCLGTGGNVDGDTDKSKEVDCVNTGVETMEESEGAETIKKKLKEEPAEQTEEPRSQEGQTVKTSQEHVEKKKSTKKSTYHLENTTMSKEFLLDQVREDNFTDLDIICSDGYVQVHRCLLMGASKFLRNLLIDKGVMDTTAITLPDVSVRHLKQVLALVYSGKTVIDKSEEGAVFSTMMMLQFPVNDLFCRTARENDVIEVVELKHISTENIDDLELEPDRKLEDSHSAPNVEPPDDAVAESQDDADAICSKIESPTHTNLNNDAGNVDGVQGNFDIENEDPEREVGKEEVGMLEAKDVPAEEVACSQSPKEKEDKPIGTPESSANISKERKRKPSEDDKPQEDADESSGSISQRLRKRTKKDSPSPIKLPVRNKKQARKKCILFEKEESESKTVDESNSQSPVSIQKESPAEESEKDLPKEPMDTSNSNGSEVVSGVLKERRLSSSSSASSNGTANVSGSRVFLETKELYGQKYNIYGLVDPIKGLQSGKTIAIIASHDLNVR